MSKKISQKIVGYKVATEEQKQEASPKRQSQYYPDARESLAP